MLACAGEGGLLEGFDPRSAQPVGCLDAAAAMGAVSAIECLAHGMGSQASSDLGYLGALKLGVHGSPACPAHLGSSLHELAASRKNVQYMCQPRAVTRHTWAPGVVQAGQDLTAVAFEEAGLQCAVGTSQGLVGVFDLRAAKPLAIKDHMYSDAIRSIQYHQLPSDSGKLMLLVAHAAAWTSWLACVHHVLRAASL